ncbi:hypothetical protein [Pontibacter pamirensis]|uniref:hypothetical protein n=1 Tax=Pontibacter pamirensis TaxID=2562824 RepID=UPI0013894B3A|nr:hypothetical protein [Pontibacter pamirensis]
MSILVYVLNFLLIGGLVWWMQRQEWAKTLRPYFFPALGLKMICGVLLGLLYTYYYAGGDTTTYHSASLILTAYARQDVAGYLRLLFFNEFESDAFRATLPFTTYADFSNSFYFIKLLSVLNLITSGFYYLNALYLSLFSFWGAARLTAVLCRLFPQWRSAAAVAFLFFPSVAFWSAGLSKDALMFGSMCWVISFALSVAHGERISFWQLLLLPLMLYIFIKVKLFYSAAIIPLLLLYITIKSAAEKVNVLKQQPGQVGAFVFAVAGGLLLAVLLQDFLPIDFLLEHSTRSYYALLEMSVHGPHMVLESMEPSIRGIVYSFPEAMASAVYRPFIGEAREPLYVLLGLENLLLLLLSVIVLASLIKGTGLRIELIHVLFLLFVLLLGGIVGLTTPNFGTLSRYRIVFLPFLVYLLLQNRFAQRLLAYFRL